MAAHVTGVWGGLHYVITLWGCSGTAASITWLVIWIWKGRIAWTFSNVVLLNEKKVKIKLRNQGLVSFSSDQATNSQTTEFLNKRNMSWWFICKKISIRSLEIGRWIRYKIFWNIYCFKKLPFLMRAKISKICNEIVLQDWKKRRKNYTFGKKFESQLWDF